MNRGPTASNAISFASRSIRPLAFARNPQKTRGSNQKFKLGSGVLFVAMLGASQLAVIPAYADEEQMQRQIDAMKRQLDAMQRELAQTKKQSAQQQAATAPQQAGAAPPQVVTARNGNEIIIPPSAPPAGGSGQGSSFPVRWHSRLDGRVVHRFRRCMARA